MTKEAVMAPPMDFEMTKGPFDGASSKRRPWQPCFFSFPQEPTTKKAVMAPQMDIAKNKGPLLRSFFQTLTSATLLLQFPLRTCDKKTSATARRTIKCFEFPQQFGRVAVF